MFFLDLLKVGALRLVFSPFSAAARLSVVLVACATAGVSAAVLSVASALSSVVAKIARNLASADCRYEATSFALYVSQNSRLAEPCNNFLTFRLFDTRKAPP